MRLSGTARWTALLVCAALVIAVAVALFAPSLVPGYDSSFTLAWGRDLVNGAGLDFSQPSSPTPHPLALMGGAALGLVPVSASFHVAIGFTCAMFVVLMAFLALITREFTTRRIAVATTVAIAIVSAPAWLLVLNAASDITYCALAALAVLLTLRHRRVTAIALFMVAALLRPEAAVLALVPLASSAFASRRARRQTDDQSGSWAPAFWTFSAGVVTAAVAWLAMGAAGGDILVGFNSAAANADTNDNPQGLGAAITSVLPGLAGVAGWLTLGAAAIALCAAALRWPSPKRGGRSSTTRVKRQEASSDTQLSYREAVLTVAAFVGVSALIYLAQGVIGTPLVARYLLFPSFLCVSLAAACVGLAGRLMRTARGRTVAECVTAVVLLAGALFANVGGWHDVIAARHTRQEAFAAASELLNTDLARSCHETFVVRSPAMVALTALALDRPLHDVTVAAEPGRGVLLQPRTVDAAELAGYGPLTPLSEQAVFPTQAPPRQSNAHWALYSACQP